MISSISDVAVPPAGGGKDQQILRAGGEQRQIAGDDAGVDVIVVVDIRQIEKAAEGCHRADQVTGKPQARGGENGRDHGVNCRSCQDGVADVEQMPGAAAQVQRRGDCDGADKPKAPQNQRFVRAAQAGNKRHDINRNAENHREDRGDAGVGLGEEHACRVGQHSDERVAQVVGLIRGEEKGAGVIGGKPGDAAATSKAPKPGRRSDRPSKTPPESTGGGWADSASLTAADPASAPMEK